MAVSAADVSKLRKATGAGMMDCKKALTEADGDFDKAVDIIRKKGQAIANKRADREATEGVVLSKVSADGKKGALVVLNCETDFVAKNESFVALTQSILDLALASEASNADEVKDLQLNGVAIKDVITEQIGVIGEKIDMPYFDVVKAEQVVAYIHPGNKLATLVGRSEEHTSELQSRPHLVCRLLLEKKKKKKKKTVKKKNKYEKKKQYTIKRHKK